MDKKIKDDLTQLDQTIVDHKRDQSDFQKKLNHYDFVT